MVKVQDSESLASHTGPESCVAAREGRGEALTGEGAGRVSSREIHALVRKQEAFRGADAVEDGGRQHRVRREGESCADPARSETPSTPRITLRGSREVSRLPATVRVAGRIGKPKGVRR
jgi:hypothetical protein